MEDYNWIRKPLQITRDKRLTPIMQDYLCLIAQLEKNAEGCYASNSWFAKYFDVSTDAVKDVLKRLRTQRIIKSTVAKRQGKKITLRLLTVIDAASRASLFPTDGDGKQCPPSKEGEDAGEGMGGSTPPGWGATLPGVGGQYYPEKVNSKTKSKEKSVVDRTGVRFDSLPNIIRCKFTSNRKLEEYIEACGGDVVLMEAYLRWAETLETSDTGVYNSTGLAITMALEGRPLPDGYYAHVQKTPYRRDGEQ